LHGGIEVSERRIMGLVRRHAGRVHQFAKGSAVAKQEQRDLRVGEFAEGVEEFTGLVNTLAGVTFAELFAADGSTQKLEIAISLLNHFLGECVEDVGLCTNHGDKLALACVE